jgi:RNA-binding protein
VTDLTGKQRRFLRGRGQTLPTAVVLGKAGLSQPLVRQIAQQLQRQELIKVRLPAGPPAARRSAAAELADAVGASCVGVVGRAVLLYRPNDEVPAHKRIPLP